MIRARYPNVPQDRGKAIMFDVLKKVVQPGRISQDALLDELNQRFAAECP